ncbi:MAG: glycoside hydrolase family 35 [Lachnospiraceae bacterium]|nr:glycoside hydrolase family 35 [Lachnospiraceae bacterium]
MDYYFKNYEAPHILTDHLNMGGENPAGERIDVTSLYFMRNSIPWIGVIGEFHFSRYNKEYWQEELCKMKAGGVTIVTTYLFWLYHEEVEGKFDFTGDNDVRLFVLEAKKAGLDVILRIGPWAHGECRNGGFPDWLLKKPYKLRDNNTEYMEQVRIFYSEIAKQVKGLFYRDGGNIIGIQVENEYVDNADHLAALKKLAIECGMEVPLYVVTGWNSTQGARIPVDEVVPLFGGYCALPWEQHIEKLPPSMHYFFNQMRNDSAIGKDLQVVKADQKDGWQLPYERYPFATCELGGGSQVTHHRRPCISGMDIYALALVKLGSGNNLPGYYMYHGGTNKIGRCSTFQESRATGYPNDVPILSYDFQAPLSEYGEVREQYRLLHMLNLFVQEFGDKFATMSAVDAAETVRRDDKTSLRYGMRTDGTSGFVFVNHYQRLDRLEEVKGAVIHAENVTFPPMDIKGDISFFFPFQMNLSGQILEYATAQPLCRQGNTYFFIKIPGISAEYRFKGGKVYRMDDETEWKFSINGTNIVTISWEQARFARKLSGNLYIGKGCDLYEMDGELKAVEEGEFHYEKWNGTEFETSTIGKMPPALVVRFEEVDEKPFTPEYQDELFLGGERTLRWKKIVVNEPDGFVEIEEIYDVAQIYADKKMVADSFYYGKPWRVPANLLYGKETYLVMSELKDDIYKEF